MEEGVVAHASTLMGEREKETDRLLTELGEKRKRVEEELRVAETMRVRAEALEKEYRERTEKIREAEREVKKTFKKRLVEDLSVARGEIRRILEEVKAERKKEQLIAARKRLDQLEERRTLQKKESPSREKLNVGERVEITHLGIEGILLDDPEGKRRVRLGIGNREVMAEVSSLARVGGTARGLSSPSGEAPIGRFPATEAPESVDLRGKGVEDALGELERFLDRATCSGLQRVILIHGHGTGTLKKGVREYLKGSPYVKAFRTGEIFQGGDGVTVVDLNL